MNAKLDKHDARIVEALTICNQLQSRLWEIEEAAALRHSETVAAILTGYDGNSTAITRRPTADFENQPGFFSSNVSQIQFLYGKEAVKDDGTSNHRCCTNSQGLFRRVKKNTCSSAFQAD